MAKDKEKIIQQIIDFDPSDDSALQRLIADIKSDPPDWSGAYPCKCKAPHLYDRNFGRAMRWCRGCDRFHSWVE